MNHLIQKQTKSKFNKLWHAGGNKYFCNIFQSSYPLHQNCVPIIEDQRKNAFLVII